MRRMRFDECRDRFRVGRNCLALCYFRCVVAETTAPLRVGVPQCRPPCAPKKPSYVISIKFDT